MVFPYTVFLILLKFLSCEIGLSHNLTDVWYFFQVELCAEECIPKGPHPCDSTVFELCNLLMQENDHNAPSDGEEAVQLYCMLRLAIHAGL